MMSSSVTRPVEEEGLDVDEVEGVGGAAGQNRLDQNCASLCLTVAVSMAHITEKWSETGKGTEKWRKIFVIAEGKISLSQVVGSL